MPSLSSAALAAVVLLQLVGGGRTAGRGYRSIIGDPGMRWAPAGPSSGAELGAVTGQGPRMELFFYGLCSKAGYSNLSVVPAQTDTCEQVPGVVGIGSVETVGAVQRVGYLSLIHI